MSPGTMTGLCRALAELQQPCSHQSTLHPAQRQLLLVMEENEATVQEYRSAFQPPHLQ